MSGQQSPSLAIHLPIYSERGKSQAVKQFCRAGPKSDFSPEVRQRILVDVERERVRLVTETVSEAIISKRILANGEIKLMGKAEDTIAAYYGVSSRTIRGWKKKRRTVQTGLETKHRPGRPRQITSPIKRTICDAFNEGNGRSVRGTTSKLLTKRIRLPNGEAYETFYRGEKRTAPSKSSISRVLRRNSLNLAVPCNENSEESAC